MASLNCVAELFLETVCARCVACLFIAETVLQTLFVVLDDGLLCLKICGKQSACVQQQCALAMPLI